MLTSFLRVLELSLGKLNRPLSMILTATSVFIIILNYPLTLLKIMCIIIVDDMTIFTMISESRLPRLFVWI